MDVIEEKIAHLQLKRKIRSDAVYMVSFVLTASPEFFKLSTPTKQNAFFRDYTQFFKDKYGEENILSAIVHLDETNPHMHLNLVPISNGRLCAKELFDGKLAKLQTEIWKEVGQRYGLERGKEGNDVEHLSTAEYKAKQILDEAQTKKSETQEYAEALIKAEQSEFAHTKSGLRKQITALLAENETLKKRLNTSMQETLDYAQEIDELKQYKIRASKAVVALSKLQEENPQAFTEIISPKKKPKLPTKFNGWTK